MRYFIYLIAFFIFSEPLLANDQDRSRFVAGESQHTQLKIDKIRDSVLNTNLQLRMFQEILKAEGINKSYPKITLRFSNQLSNRYRIFSVDYIVNGVKTYSYQISDEEKKRGVASINIQDYSTTLPPGNHNITALINFMGNDSGVFSYLAEYKVQVESENEYKFERNFDYVLTVNATEKGGLLADFKDRVSLEVDLAKIAK